MPLSHNKSIFKRIGYEIGQNIMVPMEIPIQQLQYGFAEMGITIDWSRTDTTAVREEDSPDDPICPSYYDFFEPGS